MSHGKLAAFFGFAIFVTAQPASAAIKAPACPELARFGQELDVNKAVPLNKAQGRISLPALFIGPRMEQVFGQLAPAWSQEDIAAAMKLVGDCGNEARRTRDAAGLQALTALYHGLGHLRSVLGAVAATDQRLDQRVKLFVDSEPSRPMLVSLMAVASVRDGGAESFAKAEQALKEHSVQIGAWHPVHTHAQQTLALLRDAPTKSWDRVLPVIERRINEIRQWVIADAKAAIDATPESPEGLKGLGPALAKTKAELARWLPERDLADLDKSADLRRNAIEDGLLAKVTAAIEAAPASPEGLNQLLIVQASPVKAALSPQRASALDGKIAGRRAAIGSAVADEQIRRLGQFPATMAGLRELDAFRNSTGRGLEALAGAEPAARFREAAARRATAIGEEALPAFRKSIAEMPATEQGLATFDAAMVEIKGPLAVLDAGIRQRYLDTAAKRREEIVTGVANENARLAKLPLAGSVYVDEALGTRIEFRDRTRVYIAFGADKSESPGEYRVDGDRVIIRSVGAGFDDVLRREGAWLRGHGYNLRRQTAK
jgi:hypothetical protein